ncbi:MAG: hypothetical protein ABWY82_25930 [Tardiphaga sp.]
MVRGVFGFCSIAAVAFAASIAATASWAYTADQQQLCTDDAFRLCSSAIPDVDRVTACRIQRREQLSPGCAQFFREPAAEPVVTPVRARKALGIKPRKSGRPRS